MSDFYKLCEEEYMTYDKTRKYLYTEETLQEVCLGINSMCVGSESKYFNGHTNVTDGVPFDNDLFLQMLKDREEIENAELGDEFDETVHIRISDAYQHRDNDENLRALTQREVELMCAKHLLWLSDESGEQADFSGCLLRGIKLDNKELENAIFDGAKLVNVDMTDTDMSYATFIGTRIANGYLCNCTVTEADFTQAEISNTQISQCDMSSSNYKKATMRNCNVYKLNMRDSCIERTSFRGTKKSEIDLTDCSETEKEWIAGRYGVELENDVDGLV